MVVASRDLGDRADEGPLRQAAEPHPQQIRASSPQATRTASALPALSTRAMRLPPQPAPVTFAARAPASIAAAMAARSGASTTPSRSRPSC